MCVCLCGVSAVFCDCAAAAKLMWFERMESWLGFLERNVMYPAVFMSGLTSGFPSILEKFGSGLISISNHTHFSIFVNIVSLYTELEHLLSRYAV